MSANSHENVEGYSSEEEDKEGCPLDVFHQGLEKPSFTNAITQDCEAQIGHYVEHNDQNDED